MWLRRPVRYEVAKSLQQWMEGKTTCAEKAAIDFTNWVFFWISSAAGGRGPNGWSLWPGGGQLQEGI
jgi:hypothetical protein